MGDATTIRKVLPLLANTRRNSVTAQQFGGFRRPQARGAVGGDGSGVRRSESRGTASGVPCEARMMAGHDPVSGATPASNRSRGRSVIPRSIVQGLRVSKQNTVAPQASARPALLLTVAVPKTGVIGFSMLQRLTIPSGQLST